MPFVEISDSLYEQLSQQAAQFDLSLHEWLERHLHALVGRGTTTPNLNRDSDIGAALAESRAQFQAIFEHALDAIILADDDGIYLDANPAACMMLGCTRDEVVGRSFVDFTPPQTLDNGRQAWSRFEQTDAQMGEYRLLRKDGTVITTEFRAVRDILPGVHLSILRDISERKRAEQALSESEMLHRALINHLPKSAILVYDHDLRYVLVGGPELEAVGFSKAEMEGRLIHEVLPADFVAQVEPYLYAALRGETHSVELPFNADTTYELAYVPLSDDDGRVVYGLILARNISDRKRAEVSLRQSEANYRALAENFPDGLIALYDHDLRYTVANGGGLVRVGLTSEALEGRRLRDVFPPEVYERDEPALLAALRGETTEQEVSFLDEWFRVTTLPVRDSQGNILCGMVMSQRITDIKRAELRQRELLEQLELAIRTAKLGVWQLDMKTSRLAWNAQQHEIYGITPEQFSEDLDTWRNATHPEDRVSSAAEFERLFIEGQVEDVRYRIVRPDGELRYINASGTAIYDERGTITKLIGINVDVTDYERSKRDLRASEARYRALFDGSTNAIVVYDAQARFVMVNEAAASGLGKSPHELIGRPLGDFIPQNQAMTVERIRQVLESGETLYIEDYIEVRGIGYWFWSALQPVSVEGENARHVQIISYNITERKRAAMLEAERAELIDKLEVEQATAELRSKLLTLISHELRTPMTVIMTASHLLSKYHDRLSAEKRQEKLASIQMQIEHLHTMLDDITTLTHANRGFLELRPTPTDVAQLARAVVRELNDTASPTHTLHLVLDGEPGEVLLDSKLMRHALMNLLTNAIKYSPDGGTITLSVVRVGDMCRFSVRDQGIGIPSADQGELFKPFSRASNVGSIGGTGLGLSIVREIAERHGGTVRVESQVGVGSTFIIAIPTHRSQA